MDLGADTVALLVGSGLVAGFVNAAAGGGSLLTIPALALAGLPWDQANASNRVAVLAQSAATVVAFRRAGRLDVPAARSALAPTLFGAVVGALLAVVVDPSVLEPLIVVMLIGVGGLMAARPRLLIPRPGVAALAISERRIAWPLLFLTGVYGGFLQAGVGYFLIAVTAGVLRHDLIRANAIKALVIAAFTVVALALFVAEGMVDWVGGAILAVASTVGSLASVRFQLRVSPQVLRWLIVAMVAATCVAVLTR